MRRRLEKSGGVPLTAAAGRALRVGCMQGDREDDGDDERVAEHLGAGRDKGGIRAFGTGRASP